MDELSDDHLQVLTYLPHLRKLAIELACNRVTTHCFDIFGHMRALRSLRLQCCQGITSLEGLEKCSMLEEFAFYPDTVYYKPALPNSGNDSSTTDNNTADDTQPCYLHVNDARAISRLTDLRVLKLYVAPDEEGMRHLSTLQNLTKLVIRKDPYLPRNNRYPVHLDYAEASHVLFGFPKLKVATLAGPRAREVREIYHVSDLYFRLMQRGVNLYVEDVFTEQRHKQIH